MNYRDKIQKEKVIDTLYFLKEVLVFVVVSYLLIMGVIYFIIAMAAVIIIPDANITSVSFILSVVFLSFAFSLYMLRKYIKRDVVRTLTYLFSCYGCYAGVISVEFLSIPFIIFGIVFGITAFKILDFVYEVKK